jgi:Lar family restriction alleviation protein
MVHGVLNGKNIDYRGGGINMSKPVELKPCPFCGGKGKMKSIFLGGTYDEFFVVCESTKCHATGPVTKSTAWATRIWNRRKP